MINRNESRLIAQERRNQTNQRSRKATTGRNSPKQKNTTRDSARIKV